MPMVEKYRDALPVNTRLKNYELKETLGAGGFGITYLAIDVDLNTKVAIKEYLPNVLAIRDNSDSSWVVPRTSDSESDYRFGMDKFLEEARTLARFKEPHIVSVKRFFKANNTAYIVMDYEEGQSLKDFILANPNPDETTLKNIIFAILDGLRVIHDQGFLHRDIKPSNIYIRDDGPPVLIDFGSARQALGDHSYSMTEIVSAGYTPFEQYSTRGKQGPWTDLYAIGATLYFCISGSPPVVAVERIEAISEGSPDPYISASIVARRSYSDGFLSGIDWMLESSVKNRPQDIDSVIERLNQGTPSNLVDVKPISEPQSDDTVVQLFPETNDLSKTTKLHWPEPDKVNPPQPRSNRLRRIFSSIGGFFISVLAKIRNSISVLVAAIGAFFGLFSKAIRAAINRFGSFVSKLFNAFGKALRSTLSYLIAVVRAIPKIFRLLFNSIFNSIAKKSIQTVSALNNTVRAVAKGLSSFSLFVIEMGGHVAGRLVKNWRLTLVSLSIFAITFGVFKLLNENRNPAISEKTTSVQVRSDDSQQSELVNVPDTSTLNEKIGSEPSVVESDVTQPDLETKKQIDELIAQAGEDIANWRLTRGKGGNAFDKYREILELDPDNNDVRDGIQLLVEKYNGLFNAAIASGKYGIAKGHLKKMQYILSETSELNIVTAQQLLSQANERLSHVGIKMPGTIFQDALKDGGFGPRMMALPVNRRFRMGDIGNVSMNDEEKPVHEVRINYPIAMGLVEVTFDQYDQFATATGREMPNDEGWGREKRPVIHVTWYEAVAYTSWLSEQTGKTYRLPSEAEWEYAARAGSSKNFSFGDSKASLCRYGNGADISTKEVYVWSNPHCNDRHQQTAPIAAFKPNRFGLYDMHGNVWEWVMDCWHGNYSDAPTNGHVWEGGDCTKATFRGGSWYNIAAFLRSAKRNWDLKSFHGNEVGFRVARDL